MAERHAAKQHQFGRQMEELPHGALPGDPGLLRAGMQAIAAGQHHDGLDEAAEIGPLRRQHGAIDGEEQPDRRTEELEILGILPIAAGTILARDADGAVKLLADGKAAGAVRLFEVAGKDLVFAALAFRQFAPARRQQRLERLDPRTGDGVDAPDLQIAARRRARRALDDLAHGCFGYRVRQESPAGIPAGDSLAHVHEKTSATEKSHSERYRHKMKVTMTPIRFCTFGLIAALAITPSRAMVGGAPPAADGAGRSVVMILGEGGTQCTATAIARDLLDRK